MHFVFDKGRWRGQQLISPALFDEQTKAPYPNATFGKTPWAGRRYGLTAWIDRDAGYYAILGMDCRRNARSQLGVGTEQRLKSLIVKAMQEMSR